VSFLFMLVLSGALPHLSFHLPGSTWLVWAALLTIVCLEWRRASIGRLMAPSLPYLLWLYFYLAWGLIVSPSPNWGFAFKVGVITPLVLASMAYVLARAEWLKLLASLLQVAIILNFAFMLLAVLHPKLAEILLSAYRPWEEYDLGVTRYGGLWGNPNLTGYICLIAIILSTRAGKVLAWMGRLSALPLLCLSGSRKALILGLVVLLLYPFIVHRGHVRLWFLLAVAAVGLGLTLTFSDGLRGGLGHVRQNPIVSRVLDLDEREASARGNETRMDLLQGWMGRLGSQPWYGYGLQAMAGSQYSKANGEGKVISRGLYPVGTHNTYLGVWVDIGPVGFAAFLLAFLYYVKSYLACEGEARTRWALLALMVCNLLILLVSHDHLFCFEGLTVYALFFLLPGCGALGRPTGVAGPEGGS